MDMYELFSTSLSRTVKNDVGLNELVNNVTLLLENGDTYFTIVLYQTWIKHHADDPLLSIIYYNLGVVFMNAGHADEAKTCFVKSTELDPLFLQAYINLGNIFAKRGQGTEAHHCLMHALNNLNTVKTLSSSQMDFKRVIDSQLERVKKMIDPLSLSLAIQKSMLCKKTMICKDDLVQLDFDPAFVYHQTLMTEPNPKDAPLLLGYIFHQQGQNEKAVEWAGHAMAETLIQRHLTFQHVVEDENVITHTNSDTPCTTIHSFVIEVASGCQYDCSNCAHGELRKNTKGYQLSMEQLHSFIECTEKSHYHIKELSIHGPGEPLLWKHLNVALPILANSPAIETIILLSNGRNLDKIKEETWRYIDGIDISLYENDYELSLDNLAEEHQEKLNIMRKNYFWPRVEKHEAFDTPCICISKGPMQMGDTVFLYCGPQVFDAAELLGIDIYDLDYLYAKVGEDYLAKYNPSNVGNMAICRHCWANGNRYRYDAIKPTATITTGGGWQ